MTHSYTCVVHLEAGSRIVPTCVDVKPDLNPSNRILLVLTPALHSPNLSHGSLPWDPCLAQSSTGEPSCTRIC